MSDIKGFEPEYDDKKEADTIIFGKAKSNLDGSTFRKVELLIDEYASYISEKNTETVATPTEFSIKENITLYESPGGQQKIHCWLMESTAGKRFNAIRISRRTGKGVYGSQEVTLLPKAIISLQKF